MMMVQKDLLTYMQYRHLTRASLLSICSSYAGFYIGPEAGTLAIAMVFYLFFTYEKFNERQNRILKKKKANDHNNDTPRQNNG